jgi:glucosamine-phosphate N-acetyltransferase
MKSILHLKEKDYQSYFELINEWKVSKFSNEVFRNFINDLNENHQLFGLFDNDELNATASVLFEKKMLRGGSMVMHIEDVVVRKNQRGKNVGKELIQFLVELGKQRNCYKIILNCDESVKKFYEKCGFSHKNVEMSIYF